MIHHFTAAGLPSRDCAMSRCACESQGSLSYCIPVGTAAASDSSGGGVVGGGGEGVAAVAVAPKIS